MKTINVIGLDMALSNCGIAVATVDPSKSEIVKLLHLQNVTTSKSKERNTRVGTDHVARAREINAAVSQVINDFDIRFAFGEIPSGGKSAAVATSFGIVQGLFACLPVPLFELTPAEVKMRSVNDRHADKPQIMSWATTLPTADNVKWPTGTAKNDFNVQMANGRYLLKAAEHIADACAVIKAGITGNEFRRALAMLHSLI